MFSRKHKTNKIFHTCIHPYTVSFIQCPLKLWYGRHSGATAVFFIRCLSSYTISNPIDNLVTSANKAEEKT